MKLNNKRRIVTNVLAVLLVLIVSFFVSWQFINVDETEAAPKDTIEIKVNKVTTVSIYVFGPGVEFISSASNYDTYEAEVGTTIRLQAVNETRIFTGWTLSKTENDEEYIPTGVDLTKNIINVPITSETEDLTVTVTRRDALAEDYGKYMLDRFVIVDDYDLIALQNILAGSNDNADFAKYYENEATYNTTEKKDKLRKDLQYGYFLIANNFTVFSEEFTGIGSKDVPFQGVMCGKNGNISKLFITITADEQTTDSYYGLFKYLGEEAVVRNLIVSTSIGIAPVEGTGNTQIYAGGLAGVINQSTLVNVEVAASISVDSNLAENIYAGGLAGNMTAGSGIDSISDVVFQGTDAKWSIVSHKEDSTVHAGLIAGHATDTYIKEADIITTDLNVDIKNDAVEGSYTSSKLYLGNLFGSYEASADNTSINDIMIMGNSGQSLKAMTTNGDAMVGGLIGYVNASNAGSLVGVENVYFRVIGAESNYIASTINSKSVGNVYSGGIFGFVEGSNAFALDAFKQRLETITLEDGSEKLEADYLFTGNYVISALQNGRSLATSNGKAIAGGIIGKGLFNLNGTDTLKTNLALADPDSNLLVEATQSKLTSTNGTLNDKEHACAALIYGSVGNTNVNMNNINVYSNNTTVKTVREIGSKALGDLHTGGFISYATGSTFENINMYLNDSKVAAESLSYEGTNSNEDTNSAFCGGFSGELLNNSSLTNLEFAGFDTSLFNTIGTTSCVESIQNTIPGGENYMGENYIGGVVGRIQYAAIENCKFIGSESSKDYIKMSGHESPDSAFCGGIVGLIRTAKYDVPASVVNCEVVDTEVIGNATCIITTYGDPDIYVGGIVGSAYIHDTNVTINISGCRLTRSSVYALGIERIASFAGGIIGGSTWQSSIAISDCYVVESSIKANITTRQEYGKGLESTAGGIMGGMKGNPNNENVRISSCAVIDTDVDAEVDSTDTDISAYAAGILGFMQNDSTNVYLSNCYSNALVTASHLNASGTKNVYGITFYGTIQTTSQQVNETVYGTFYKDFEYGNYTFVVVSRKNGTYIIKNSSGEYARIYRSRNSYSISYGELDEATPVTYQPTTECLIYRPNNNTTRYISLNNRNALSTTNNASNALKFSTETITETGTYTDLVDVAAGNSYYLSANVKNPANNLGTAVNSGPFNIPNNQTVSPYSGYNYLNEFDGFGQKFYIEILDNDSKIKANNSIDTTHSVTSTSSEASTALANIWINAKTDGGVNGDTLIAPNHNNKEEAAQNGWFILDCVVLYTGSITDIACDITNLKTTYVDGNKVYEHKLEGDTHYVVNKNDNSDRIQGNFAENSIVINANGQEYPMKEFTFKVYDDMLMFVADFELTHFSSTYQLRFFDASGNIIDDALFAANYGDMSLVNVVKNTSSAGGYFDGYHLEYKPNEKIEEDVTFYVRFVGGNNDIAATTTFKINLIANELKLVGVTYADYTPPLNYYDQSGTLGTTRDNPYRLHIGSITKFIPIFTKSNDIVPGTKYVLEDYIEECSYSLDSSSDNYFDVHSNGELKSGTTAYSNVGKLTVTHKKTGHAQVVYFSSSRDISVSYSSIGSEMIGLTHASNSTDFYFEQEIYSNYSGVPDLFTIKIDATTYILTEKPNAYYKPDIPEKIEDIKVYGKFEDGTLSSEPITSYDPDYVNYVVMVSQSLLENANSIEVKAEYPVACTITFKLQCESFNDIGEENSERSYKVISGTKFKDFFTSEVISELEAWAESARVFGYVFTGFYLVNDANSIHSYGKGFNDLVNSEYKINSSNTFFGRWSYLVELVEAPGTHIKTGFNGDFLFDYIEDDFTRKIQIPINANQGYVFRIEKDSHYIGEVGVEANIVREIDDQKVMTKVELEYYQDNKNLYYVRPENITGYLVIMTTVGNSEVIVGEHTSSVTENITPEDGIVTFKYVVNHYYKEDGSQSYIFNLGNGLDYSTLNKEFVLDFYRQSTGEDLKLPDFTEIRVYYNCYVNGSTTPSNTLVGTYITYNDDRVYLTEFKMLDLETPAFGNNITFKEFLERDVTDLSNFSVTEVYYFSIIPPNGHSEKVQNEIVNFVVECGYVESKVEQFTPVSYLKGVRTTLDLANPDDLQDVVTGGESVYESAKQQKIYNVTPSRNTMISENSGVYTFIDNNTYSVYDIILTDTQKLPDFNYISLYDGDKQSILESTLMKFNIKELRLRLGYRLGNVKIYGKTMEGDWEEVAVLNVNSAVYQDYKVNFIGKDPENPYPYHAFKIDNISSNEIRISEIDVLSGTNGILYEGAVTDFTEKSVDGNKYTYSLTKEITGDSRHDGKVFMLAIQLKDKSGNIVENIDGSIYLEVKDIGLGISHKVYLDEYLGKNVGYVNLSKIIRNLNVKQISFEIHIPDKYDIYAVQLLEVSNEFKPASGEVRDKLINTILLS